MNIFCVVLGVGPVTRQNHEGVRTNVRSNTRAKRRRARGDGTIQLQFVTATNPAQFKDENARKSVRSQAAMLHYIRKAELEGKMRDVEPTVEDTGPQHPPEQCPENQDPLLLDPCTEQEAQTATERHAASDHYKVSLQSASSRNSLTYLMHSMHSASAANARVVTYELSTSHEEALARMLAVMLANFHQIGDGVDPFNVIPQYENPELSAVWLQRNCMRAFASAETMKKWVPYMLSHQDVILSSPLLASTWLDMNEGCSGPSRRTAMVRSEILATLDRRLSCQDPLADETTLIVILHLLGGEMWSCDEDVIRTHKAGMLKFVSEQGGLDNLSNPAIAEVAACVFYHCDIFCEITESTVFHDWQLPALPIDPYAWNLPESPLVCLTPTFITLETDLNCRPHTLQLLEDMRYLTDLFVGEDTCSIQFDSIKLEIPADHHSRSTNRHAHMEEISRKIAALPSAYIPGKTTSGDWIYEACRIAALIYTTAILTKVPFSVAAEDEYTLDTVHINNIYRTGSPSHSRKPHLTEALFEVLKRTDTGNLWNDMSGVLYWVTAVGAAAARRPATMDLSPRVRFWQEEYSIWVRRCLTMHSTRAMIVLIFRHPIPILLAQKRLMRVQELLGISVHQPLFEL